MRGAERILLSRHQVRRDGAGVEISFLEDRFVAQVTVEAEANAEIPVPVAACALSLLEILVRVARDGHERTLGVNTFGEQLVRSDVVAADLNRLQNEKSFSNVKRSQIFSHFRHILAVAIRHSGRSRHVQSSASTRNLRSRNSRCPSESRRRIWRRTGPAGRSCPCSERKASKSFFNS